MFAKSVVKGERANPFYQQLARITGSTPRWNFHKYLINRDATQVAAFGSMTKPDDGVLLRKIDEFLKLRSRPCNAKQRIAVVGAGISGLASAWLLSRQHDVTLFEAGDYLGGHTNTVDVTLEGRTHPVDTGFLVFNEKTYPNLIALFALLGVDSVETEMSFAVSLENPDLEWAGSNLATVFGQKRNLLRPQFWTMLSDILRFNRESAAWLATHPDQRRSLRDFLAAGRYSSAFADWYLLPMAAAIWSCPTGQMLDMPLATFIRFCQNHGLLQVFDRPLWRTVKGGGREYVRKIAAQLDDIRLACPGRRSQPRSHSACASAMPRAASTSTKW